MLCSVVCVLACCCCCCCGLLLVIGVSAYAVSIALVLSYLLVASGIKCFFFSLSLSLFLFALRLSHAPRVHIRNVLVCTGTTRTRVSTCARVSKAMCCTHTPCRTHIFSDTCSLRAVQTPRARTAQGVCGAHVISPHLTFSLSLCFIHRPCCSRTVTSTLRSCLHPPCRTVPDPKAQVKRTCARAARSLATWLTPRTPQVMSPKEFDKFTSADGDTTTSTIQTTITSLTSRKSHMGTLDCSVFPQR